MIGLGSDKNREDDPSFGSLVNSHRSIGTLPWTPTSKVQIRLQKVRVLLQNDHRGRTIDFKDWWSTSLDWPGPTWFETGGGCDLVPQQQLGVSRGGDVGSPLLLLLLLLHLLLLELGLQRRRMFGFSLLPKSGAGGNAGPLLSQVSPISHIRKFCNGEKQSQKANMLPQFVFFLGTLSASTEAQACLLYIMNF